MIDYQILGFGLVLLESIGLLFVPKKWRISLTIITIFTIVLLFIIK